MSTSPETMLPPPMQWNRPPTVATTVFGGLAVVFAGAFGPMLFFIGVALNPMKGIPYTLHPSPSLVSKVDALEQTATAQIWSVIVPSFLLLTGLTLLTISRGRQALRQSESETASARLTKWATLLLAMSFIAVPLGVILAIFVNGLLGVIALIVVPAGVMSSLILSSILVGNRRVLDDPRQTRGRRIVVGIDFTLSLLFWLGWAAISAFSAQLSATLNT